MSEPAPEPREAGADAPPTTPAPPGAADDATATRRRRAVALALCVLGLALVWTERGLVTGDPSDVTRFLLHETRTEEDAGSFAARVDTRFVVWLVARNARTWVTGPARLFDGEICHPTERSIALGEPAFTLGLVGVPAWWATRDPIWTFNFVSVAIVALGALAMFRLVLDWTGGVTAATVAALAYGFHPVKLSDPIHLYVPDTAWTVFALLFFVRFLEHGRWRDALLLAGAMCLQIGGSLYPLIAAAAVGGPVALWGFARIGTTRTRPAQWLAVFSIVALAVAFVFGPFLDKAAAGDLATRPVQVFVSWTSLVGVSQGRLGLGLLALAALAFLPGRAGGPHGASPRFALLAGVLLCLWLATGGNEVARMAAAATGEPPPPALPNLFRGLSALLPGLEVVRLPSAIGHGAYLALAILAGLGVAAAMERLPAGARAPVSVALVVLVFVNTLRPGLPGAVPLATWSQRPSDEAIAFFDALAARGDGGPILEVPNPPRPHPRYGRSILLSAWHGRRTSGCYNSFLPPETLEAERVARSLPDADALARVAAMGFTTVLLHEDVPGAPALRARLDAAEGRGLRRIHAGAGMTAWAIEVDAAP